MSGGSISLHTLQGRLSTFRQRKGGPWVQRAKEKVYLTDQDKLSMAGFYSRPFPGSEDNVACFLCNKNLDGWEANDEAWVEHVKHAPSCPLVRLDIEANRALTFIPEIWPHSKNSSLSPDKMAKAGFYYWPRELASRREDLEDTSVCFQCGLALDGWELEDDPRYEHAKRRPECPFIKNGFAVHPFSFNFLLASKPDETAVRHISAAKTQNSTRKSISPPVTAAPEATKSNGEDKKKFELPQMPPAVKKSAPLPRISRRSSVMKPSPSTTPNLPEAPTLLSDSKEPSSTASTESAAPGKIRRVSAAPRRATIRSNNVKTVANSLQGLETLFTDSDLEVPVQELLTRLVDRKLGDFDKSMDKLCERFDSEARTIFMS